MNKITLLFLFIPVFFANILYSQSCYSPAINSALAGVTQQTVSLLDRQLSGDTTVLIGSIVDTIKSRHYLQPGNDKAAQFIYQKFQSYGLTTYYWSWSTNGKNVIGKKTGSKYPNKQYIMCAHYDDMPTGLTAPGADDNASGTVAIIEAARLFSTFTPDYTILFIAFDEEERGLYGSWAYADTAYAHGDSIMGVLNLDMIAWDGNQDNKVRILTNTNSVPFADVNLSAALLYVQNLLPQKIISSSSGSDHYHFWLRGYKATCTIEDDFNIYYHTVNDKFSNIHVPYFTNCTVASIAAFFIHAMDYKIYFTHTPLTSGNETGPRTAVFTITSPHKLGLAGTKAPRLYYKVNSGSYNYVNASYINLDTFKFTIPGQTSGTVSYYAAVQDSLSRFVGTLPSRGKGIDPPGTIVPPTQFTYDITTGIVENTQPVKFELKQNYPNPFNSETMIEFSLHKTADVKLSVFDALGREVSKLINGRITGGSYKYHFDALNLTSGVYFYTMTIDGNNLGTKSMILIK